MTRVVQILYSIESSGRAGIRLHEALTDASLNSSIISLQYGSLESETIKYLGIKSRLVSKMDNKFQTYLIQNTIKEFGTFSFPILGTNVARVEQIKNADIIYLHFILGGFLNLSSIDKLARLGKPIVFIMHDMWSLTGGCHYSFTCEKYKTKCAECQMFPKDSLIDWAVLAFNQKLKLYLKYRNLYFVAPSKWLYNCAKQASLIKNKPIIYIPNVIDNMLFKPIDKNSARNILNIDSNEIVIAFGAVSVSSPYKGWAYLQKALRLLQNSEYKDKISILIFGGGYSRQIADEIPFKTKFLGYLKDEYSTVLVYNASDVFIVPSLADNQPTTVMESLCCGTPVVGFDVGGIPDMIRHRENGYLAKYEDSEDLAKGIKFCIENRIKGRILPIFEKGQIVKKHIDLINASLTNTDVSG